MVSAVAFSGVPREKVHTSNQTFFLFCVGEAGVTLFVLFLFFCFAHFRSSGKPGVMAKVF